MASGQIGIHLTPEARPNVVTIGRQSARQRNVLLVEDNPVNQRVAVGLLIRRGHRVTLANNGLAALAALEKDRFDVVLMDVQMPEMDGLEATVRIRDRERLTGEHLRIIAMTANAMKGDRERCLGSGMDAYLPKPIAQQDLFDLVEAAPSSEGAAPGDAPEPAVLDVGQMRDRLGDDDELIADIIPLFLEDYPICLAAFERVLEERDPGFATAPIRSRAARATCRRHVVVAAARVLEAFVSPADSSGLDANLVTRVAQVEPFAAGLRQEAGTS
jgi:two-component system sensor histidine kinase/response regulator